MPYAKTEPGILNHRKFIGLNPAAIGLWTMGNAYCMDQLSDGYIPYEMIPRLICAPRHFAFKLSRTLVERGLWEESGRDYLVHDFLEYNPSKSQVLAGRSAAKQRKDRWKERRSEQRPERVQNSVPERKRNAGGTMPSSSSSSSSSNLETSLATRNGVPEEPVHGPDASHLTGVVARDPLDGWPLDRNGMRFSWHYVYPDSVHHDCADRRFRDNRCMNLTWLAAHPDVTGYPCAGAGIPMQCLQHRMAVGA